MNAWKILKRVIPDGQVKAVAARLHLSYDYVSRWRREPLGSDEVPQAGQRSPLDRIFDLIDVVFLINPKEAALVPQAVNLHYQLLTEAHGIQGFDGNCHARAIACADLLTQATTAVISLNVDGVNDETLRELVLLRNAADTVIARVGKDLAVLSPENGGE